MGQRSLNAAFMRGGTSKGLVLHARDLPEDPAEWTDILCAVMGSPDTYGRQLDGMGGGISSLSKVCVVGPPTRADADVDYTFVQVAVREARIDLRANCGNMSAAIGPFAFDEGLVRADAGRCVVRIHNTNTAKIVRATFEVDGDRARCDGDFTIPGVGSPGAPIRLDFLDPGGATTGRLLPTERPAEWIDVPGHGRVEVSLVDAANAAVFVRARDVGLSGVELPDELEARRDVLDLLEAIRREASVRMGIAPDFATAASITSVPFVCVVTDARDSITTTGHTLHAEDADLVARVVSSGQPHRALPLTIALCTAVAARLQDSIVGRLLAAPVTGPLRLAMPSGVLSVDAETDRDVDQWTARSGTFFRTARRLFDGRAWYRG
ncbi:MAG: PrpF family protein [Acidobacteria bacterium]|nr:PrpF family protein [Acidobacteriota bacterium]